MAEQTHKFSVLVSGGRGPNTWEGEHFYDAVDIPSAYAAAKKDLDEEYGDSALIVEVCLHD